MLTAIVICCLLLLQPLCAGACIWNDTHNNYLFSIYDNLEFQDRAAKTCDDNWKAYLGLPSDDSFWFTADAVSGAARAKGDTLMVSYVEHLQLYLDCAESARAERWEYPTKSELAERRHTLRRVRAYALGRLSTPLRSQYALLLMRCNMMLGMHQANVAFYEQTASRYTSTIYREMMLDIYAGALLHTGRAVEAGRIFASLGDWQSLMTQYYRSRSFSAISEEYRRDPDSPVLPFLLQDFVNNAQEATDEWKEGWTAPKGKLFVRDIQRREAMEMCALARRAATEGKSGVPLMWQSALAWLEQLYGQTAQAQADIAKTAGMEGTQKMKDCARILRLYITDGRQAGGYDSYAAHELRWLDTLARADKRYMAMKDRIVHQRLAPHYGSEGRRCTALALLRSVEAACYAESIDTMCAESLHRLMAYAKDPGDSEIDRYAALALEFSDTAMCDLMGTKHLRLCQWAEAQRWLERVPPEFYHERDYAVYAAHRTWTVEPWMKRQWLKEYMEGSDVPLLLRANPKLTFAREMERLEQGLGVLTGADRQRRCYDLAVRYAQAAFTGDCWFLMRDGKSVSDSVRTNEADLLLRARTLLQEACQAADAGLREKALFALAYGGLYDEGQAWRESVWSDEASDYITVARPQTSQYRAFEALAAAVTAGAESDYVSRCDEYRQFKRHRQP